MDPNSEALNQEVACAVFHSTILNKILDYFYQNDVKNFRFIDKEFNKRCWNFLLVHHYIYLGNDVSIHDRSIGHRIRKLHTSGSIYWGLVPYLTHLRFADIFDANVDCLPSSITHLSFGHDFDRKVDKLPSSLTHLMFGCEFDQSVDYLPSSLVHLSFGCAFNQNVDRLPSSVTHIVFGGKFNKPVDELPRSVTHLYFGKKFNQSVDRLPPGLIYLQMDIGFGRTVDHLPPGLKYLLFAAARVPSLARLPSSLKFLMINEGVDANYNDLPRTLFRGTRIIVSEKTTRPFGGWNPLKNIWIVGLYYRIINEPTC